jgi:hypothetical protein
MINMTARNPKWYNREHTQIEILVDWQGHIPQVTGEHPFVADQNDAYGHGRELFKRALDGEFGRIAEWGV